jgi:hypothetical protein
MAGNVERIVLLARYTSFLGPPSGSMVVHTNPLNVRTFSKADLAAWKGSHAGTATFDLEGSVDGSSWATVGSVTVTADQEVTTVFSTLESEWIRLKITLTDGPGFTCWMVGEFTRRE